MPLLFGTLCELTIVRTPEYKKEDCADCGRVVQLMEGRHATGRKGEEAVELCASAPASS